MTKGIHRIILEGRWKAVLWGSDKDAFLRATRGVGFEQVAIQLEAGDYFAVEENPNQERYPGQRLFIVPIRGYVHVVPFAESVDAVFLKTIIPSRKATKRHLGRGRAR